MANISKIVVGQILYDRKRTIGIRRFSFEWDEWEVEIIEIDTVRNRVKISWKGYPAHWVPGDQLKKYRLKSIYETK